MVKVLMGSNETLGLADIREQGLAPTRTLRLVFSYINYNSYSS